MGLIIILISVSLLTYISIIISNKLGLQRHRNILNSDGFISLLKKGFKIEKINDYIGLFGSYNNYLCDIYYDYTGPEKAYVINIYFTPQKQLHKINCANYDFILSMIKKYSNSMWSFRKYNYSWGEGTLTMKNKIGYKNPAYEQIIERLEIATELLIQEKLQPINKNDLDYIRANFPLQSVPWISLYNTKLIK
jgi:ABC-type oligopeptide transport system substrate-binding subunit